MKKIFLILLIFALANSLFYSDVDKIALAGEKDKYGGILKMNFDCTPSKFGFPRNIFACNDVYSFICLENLLEPSDEKSGVLMPTLAESWELAPDKSSYTFHLRKNVKFHDGTAFNAQAAKWNLDLVVASPSPILSRVESIKIIDDYTVRLNLSSWDALILSELCGQVCLIISPTAYEKHGEKWCDTHPIGTGPWKLKDFKHRQYIKFERNPNYWQKDPLYIDEIHFIHIKDSMTTMAELLKGELHASLENITFAGQMKGKGFNIDYIPMQNNTLYFNATDPNSIWSDVRMRHALEYAIDKEHICKTVGQTLVQPVNEIIYSLSKIGNLATPRKYDPEKARKLIADAGYAKGVMVKLFIMEPFMSDLVLAMKNNLSEVGIETDLQIMTPAAWRQKQRSLPLPDELRWQPMKGRSWNLLQFVYETLSPQSSRVPGLKRTEGFDELVAQTIQETEASKQIELLEKMEKLLYADAVQIPLWTNPMFNINSKKVHDVKWFTVGEPKFDFGKAWIEK